MARSRPYKKDLTPFSPGGRVIKHVGKGATEQASFGGSLTGGDPYARMANRYPKPEPEPPSEDAGEAGEEPVKSRPLMQATAPNGEDDED